MTFYTFRKTRILPQVSDSCLISKLIVDSSRTGELPEGCVIRVRVTPIFAKTAWRRARTDLTSHVRLWVDTKHRCADEARCADISSGQIRGTRNHHLLLTNREDPNYAPNLSWCATGSEVRTPKRLAASAVLGPPGCQDGAGTFNTRRLKPKQKADSL